MHASIDFKLFTLNLTLHVINSNDLDSSTQPAHLNDMHHVGCTPETGFLYDCMYLPISCQYE